MSSKSLIAYLKTVIRNPFVIAFVIGMVSLQIYKQMATARRSAPPPLVNVGPWSLTNQEGHKFGTDQLKGKVVIANFFFTRCPTICPKLISDMKAVRERFSKEIDLVQFVSFSVDPEFDTPEVLSAYREKGKLAAPNWTFLTGTTDEMVKVVTGQMKLYVGDKEPLDRETQIDELFNISHVSEFVLFDQNGDLRGKFQTDTVGLASLVRSANFLLEKGVQG